MAHKFESPKQNAAMNLRAPENIATIEDITWKDSLEEKNPELADRITKLDELADDVTEKLDLAEKEQNKTIARELFDTIINLNTEVYSIDLVAQELEPESSSGPLGTIRRQIEKRAQKIKTLSDRAQTILIGDDITNEKKAA